MTNRSIVPDYISIILRGIEKAKHDPAQLRQLVYDIARVGLGKQLIIKYAELGSEGFQRHLTDLESAISQVEILSRLEADLLPHDRSGAPLIEGPRIEGPRSPLGYSPIVVRDRLDNTDDGLPDVYEKNEKAADLLPSTQIWEATVVDTPSRSSTRRFWRLELPVALLISLAIYAVIFMRFDYIPGHGILPFELATRSTKPRAPPAALPSVGSSVEAAGGQTLDFPLPSIYGVYAVSEGKLYALEALTMRVPDPRVAISAMISSASRVTVPNGKLAFVIYRRDLASSAPDSVAIRIVARVMKELKFSQSAPAQTIDIKGEWAIRDKAIQFGVAPIKNNPEMIMLRSQDPQLSLPAGRYVLVLKNEGYDFSVAGRLADPAQCLERTDALGGMVYSECPKVP